MDGVSEHQIQQFYECAEDAVAAFRFRLVSFLRGRSTWKRALPELAIPFRLIPASRLHEEWKSLRPLLLRASAKPVVGLARRLEFLDVLLAASTKIGDLSATAHLLTEFSLALVNSARLPLAARKKAFITLVTSVKNDAISRLERARWALVVAEVNLRSGNLLECLKWVRRVRRLDPSITTTANCLVLVAEAELLSGRNGHAVQHLARATHLLLRLRSKGPELQVAQRLLVLALIRQGDNSKASMLLEMGSMPGKGSLESLALQLLAFLEAPPELASDATQLAQSLVKLLGQTGLWYPYMILHLQIGKALIQSGRHQESIAHIDSARRMAAKNRNRGMKVEAALLLGHQAWRAGRLGVLAGVIDRLARTDGLSSGKEQEARLFLLAARFSLARGRPGAAVTFSDSAWLATRETDDALRAQAIALRAHAHVGRGRMADALRVTRPSAILADVFRNIADGAPIQFVLAALHLAQRDFAAARKRSRAFAVASDKRQSRIDEVLRLLLLSEGAWWRHSPDRAMEIAARALECCLPEAPFMLKCASKYQLLKTCCLAQEWPNAARCLAEMKCEFRTVRFLGLTSITRVIARRRNLARAFQPLAAFPCW